jgi:PAS domain S-box-containing protein
MPEQHDKDNDGLHNLNQLSFESLLDYKSLLDVFHEGICVKNEEGKILYANERYCSQLGYEKSELIDQANLDLFDDEKYRNISGSKLQLRKKGITDTYEVRMRKKDGTAVWMRVSGRPFFDAGNKFVGSIATYTDITKQLEVEEELRKSKEELESLVNLRTRELMLMNSQLTSEIKERKLAQVAQRQSERSFRDIFDASPDAIFVESLTGEILDVNEEACKLHGWSREQLIGKTIYDITPSEQHEAVDTRQPLLTQGDIRVFESYAKKSDGDSVPIEVKVSKISYDKKPALLLHVRDTSERLKAQNLMHKINLELETKVRERTADLQEMNKSLQISEQLYRQIARNIPRSAIFVFNNDLRYVLAEGNLIGFISLEREHIEGKSIYELFTAEQLQEVEHIYKWTIEGVSGSYEFEQNNFIYQINYLPIRGDAGEIIYGMLMVVDISDLKKIQQKLESQTIDLKRSNEELERFAYVASHDLQGPLRTISSYLQLLESRYSDKLQGDAKEFINYSVAGAKRMQRLIHDLLNYSRINTRPKPFTEVNLNEVMLVVLKNIETSTEASGAELRIDTLPTVVGDSNQLMQLLQNLIDNAIKFVKDRKPLILINVEDHRNEWIFVVRDNGIGIQQEFKEKIFQIFQRLHAETDFPGTGIGLAICKKIAHLHGGDIWFESEPEHGTAFFFSISKSLKKPALA